MIWKELTQLTKEYQSLNLQNIIDYEKFCMISIVWHSTKIEGCSLTETNTKVLLEHDITAKGKPLKDHLMLKDHFEALLMQLCNTVNANLDVVKDENIVKLASDLHYNFMNIHPFGDGNGRTARLLMNYIQQYHNQPPIKIFTEDRAEYIDLLNEAEEQGNPDIFREFVARQQIKFLSSEIEKYKKKDMGFNLLF